MIHMIIRHFLKCCLVAIFGWTTSAQVAPEDLILVGKKFESERYIFSLPADTAKCGKELQVLAATSIKRKLIKNSEQTTSLPILSGEFLRTSAMGVKPPASVVGLAKKMWTATSGGGHNALTLYPVIHGYEDSGGPCWGLASGRWDSVGSAGSDGILTIATAKRSQSVKLINVSGQMLSYADVTDLQRNAFAAVLNSSTLLRESVSRLCKLGDPIPKDCEVTAFQKFKAKIQKHDEEFVSVVLSDHKENAASFIFNMNRQEFCFWKSFQGEQDTQSREIRGLISTNESENDLWIIADHYYEWWTDSIVMPIVTQRKCHLETRMITAVSGL